MPSNSILKYETSNKNLSVSYLKDNKEKFIRVWFGLDSGAIRRPFLASTRLNETKLVA